MKATSAARPAATLRTGRLVLRPWRSGDFAPFAALNADPRVMEYFPAPLSRAESDAVAIRLGAAIDKDGWGLWAVDAGPAAPFIGFVGLAVVGDGLPCSGALEVGWRLATAHWGCGYATEGARAALTFAFDELGLSEVVAFTAAVNARSQAVMKRLAMRRDAQTFEHPRCVEGSAIRTHVLYRMPRAAWQSPAGDWAGSRLDRPQNE